MNAFFCFLLLLGVVANLVSGINQDHKETCRLTSDPKELIRVDEMAPPAFETLIEFLETRQKLDINAVTCVRYQSDKRVYEVQYGGYKLIQMSLSPDGTDVAIIHFGFVPVPPTTAA